MSRIGKTPIDIPSGVTVTVESDSVKVKGAKGELISSIMPNISVEVVDNQVLVTRKNNQMQSRASHGLLRSLIANNIVGVTDGYKKTLKLVGTGYRVSTKGAGLSVTVGYSHPVDINPIAGIKIKAEGNDTIHIEGIDKQLVGQVSANIRKIRPPEPYKGKGIRYENEVVKIKPGKTVVG